MREHWLEHAHGRILAGDDELDVLADYGWVQIAADEREAISEVVDCLTETGTALTNPTATRNTLADLLARLA
jgi:uncharacterized protein YjhX (UPF0386 family)